MIIMRYECAFTLNPCGSNCGFYSDNNFYTIKWEATRSLKKKRNKRRNEFTMLKKSTKIQRAAIIIYRRNITLNRTLFDEIRLLWNSSGRRSCSFNYCYFLRRTHLIWVPIRTQAIYRHLSMISPVVVVLRYIVQCKGYYQNGNCNHNLYS